MVPHLEDIAATPAQGFLASPARKTLKFSALGSRIVSANLRYLKTVDGFIKLIHVVLCLYCGLSMLNSCQLSGVSNRTIAAHIACSSRQTNFILTHLSAFVLHAVILLSYVLSPLSSILLPSTILELVAGCTTFTCGLGSSILLMSAMALLDLPGAILHDGRNSAQSIENTLATSALGITTSLLCMACILRNYISLRRSINYDLLPKPTP